VGGNQRTRILEAMAEEIASHGAGASVPVGEVVARARVSSATFHEQFEDREACLLAAFELGVERVTRKLVGACDAELRWLDAIKAAIVAMLGFIEQEPALGRLLVVHSLSGGERLLRRRAAVLATLAAAVDRGRLAMAPGRQEPPAVIAEGVVGAVLTVLQNRLLNGPEAEVRDLFGSLVSIVVLPYLGAAAAQRELTRPAPRPRAAAALGGHGLAAALDRRGSVRLTYRTTCVLRAIAEYPGASNREVAERAGIVDQGQVSKLLSRLQARGLILKSAEGRSRGAPNAWRLSERGEYVVRDFYAFS
jgi:AcrR family transcriptional regulator